MSPVSESPKVLNVPECAAILRVGTAKVYELVRTSRITAFHVGRKIRIPYALLMAHIENGNLFED